MVNLIGNNKTFNLLKNTTYNITGTNDTINAADSDTITITNTGATANVLNLANNNTVYLKSGPFTVRAAATGSSTIYGFKAGDKLDLTRTDIYNKTILLQDISAATETGEIFIDYNNGQGSLTLAAFGMTPTNVTYATANLTPNTINYVFTNGGGYHVNASTNNGILIGAGTGKIAADEDFITNMKYGYVTLADNSYLQVDGTKYSLTTGAHASFVAKGSGSTIQVRGSITYAEIAGSSTVNISNKRAAGATFNIDANSKVTINNKLGTREIASLGGNDTLTLNGNNFKISASGKNDQIFGFNSSDYLDVSRLGFNDYATLKQHTQVGIIDGSGDLFTQVLDNKGNTALLIEKFDLNTLAQSHLTFAPSVSAHV